MHRFFFICIRSLRAVAKISLFCLWSLAVYILQKPLLLIYKGRASYIIPRLWAKGVCFIFQISVRCNGRPIRKRQVMYVGNHMSYLDIPAIGQFLHGSFVARGDLSRWPIFGSLARLQQTIFISRKRQDAVQGREALERIIKQGKNIILFAEGTSSRGDTVLPFKSSLFNIALNNPIDRKLPVQPFTLSLLSVDGDPPNNETVRDLYAWHGDMNLLPHIWGFSCGKGAVLKLEFHPPREGRDYDNRKKLCQTCYNDVKNALKHQEDI